MTVSMDDGNVRAELRHVSHSVLDEGEQTPAEMYEACRCTYHLDTAPHPHTSAIRSIVALLALGNHRSGKTPRSPTERILNLPQLRSFYEQGCRIGLRWSE